jgi:hypothetical protein
LLPIFGGKIMPERLQTFEEPEQGASLFGLNEQAQQLLADSVVSDYRRWKQSRSRLESKWRECWEAYLCDAHFTHLDIRPNRARWSEAGTE